jgi:hypothetical protein
MPSVTPELVISVLAFCIQVIAAAAYFYAYDAYHGDITSGLAPKGGSKDGKGGIWGYWRNWNFGFYASYSVFCFGIMSVLFAVAELGLIIKPDWFSFVDSPVLRAVIYILKGVATLGVSNDLGIAAGSMEIIIGAVMLAYAIFKGGLGALKGGGKK